jgi:hypothetical protein
LECTKKLAWILAPAFPEQLLEEMVQIVHSDTTTTDVQSYVQIVHADTTTTDVQSSDK